MTYDASERVYGPPVRAVSDETAAAAHAQTRVVEVFMAGDVEHAKQITRRFCKDNPICVTVTPTTFIYRGGEESGFVIGFRNYPRFPTDHYSLRRAAGELAEMVRSASGQDSYMVVDHGGMTVWNTTKESCT